MLAAVSASIEAWAGHHPEHIGNCYRHEYAAGVADSVTRDLLSSSRVVLGELQAQLPNGSVVGHEGSGRFVKGDRYLTWRTANPRLINQLHRSRRIIRDTSRATGIPGIDLCKAYP